MLGPFRGGRVAAATGVPGRANEFYFGAVNGGVWKTIDGAKLTVNGKSYTQPFTVKPDLREVRAEQHGPIEQPRQRAPL